MFLRWSSPHPVPKRLEGQETTGIVHEDAGQFLLPEALLLERRYDPVEEISERHERVELFRLLLGHRTPAMIEEPVVGEDQPVQIAPIRQLRDQFGHQLI